MDERDELFFEDRGTTATPVQSVDVNEILLQKTYSPAESVPQSVPKSRRVLAADVGATGDEYEQQLRTKFELLQKRPAWANRDPADHLVSRPFAGVKRSSSFPPDEVRVTTLRMANSKGISRAAVQATQFHPHAPVLFTAGYDRTLRLFKVDERENALLAKAAFPDMQIDSAAFVNDAQQILLSGKRPFLYTFDMAKERVDMVRGIIGRRERSFERFSTSADGQLLAFTGMHGEILVLSGRTRQLLFTVKMSGSALCTAFSPDGSQLYGFGSDRRVHVFDVRQRRCISTFFDYSGVHGSSIAANEDYLACGATMGVVSVYDRHSLSPSSKPLRELDHLTTTANHIAFHPSGELLAIASRRAKNALRLVHLPTLRVFHNWPRENAPLHEPTSLAFSPSGVHLAVGNTRGHCLLFRLNHFADVASEN